MDESSAPLTDLDDFEVIARRLRVMAEITALTETYKQLNQEMTRRKALRWMVP
jgi:hypothetical protein